MEKWPVRLADRTTALPPFPVVAVLSGCCGGEVHALALASSQSPKTALASTSYTISGAWYKRKMQGPGLKNDEEFPDGGTPGGLSR